MYPYEIFLGLSLYDICMCLGIIVCFYVFGYLADKHKIKRKIQNFAMLCGLGAIAIGYGSAVLFQAIYNIGSRGSFEITDDTGATFYGGLIGGVLSFLLIYFGIGYFKYDDRSHVRVFFGIADSAVPGILIAHSLGRVGCLMAGCCHGAQTDAWYGIEHFEYVKNTGQYVSAGKFIPVQLFEAVFLLFLFGFLFIRSMDKKNYCLPIYLCVYSVWRFAVEFIRGDYRGSIFTDLLTPSQFISCILFAVGIGVFFLEKNVRHKLLLIGGDVAEAEAVTEAETGSEAEAEKKNEEAE